MESPLDDLDLKGRCLQFAVSDCAGILWLKQVEETVRPALEKIKRFSREELGQKDIFLALAGICSNLCSVGIFSPAQELSDFMLEETQGSQLEGISLYTGGLVLLGRQEYEEALLLLKRIIEGCPGGDESIFDGYYTGTYSPLKLNALNLTAFAYKQLSESPRP